MTEYNRPAIDWMNWIRYGLEVMGILAIVAAIKHFLDPRPKI
jgi:hypothetical protein